MPLMVPKAVIFRAPQPMLPWLPADQKAFKNTTYWSGHIKTGFDVLLMGSL